MDVDMDVDIDLDQEFSDVSDTDVTSEGSENDSEVSEIEEDVPGPSVSKKKRGRPLGSRLTRTESDEETFRERAPRKRKIIPIECLVAVMCCAGMCLSGIGPDMMVALRENYQSLSSTERKQWLLDYFWSHSQFNEDTNKWTYLFVIGTISVCCGAFRQILGIPSTTFYAIRKLFLSAEVCTASMKNMFKRFQRNAMLNQCDIVQRGEKQRVVEEQRGRKKTTKGMAAMAWLQNYAATFGEKLPNSCSIHLPSCSTKSLIYEMMVTESQTEFAYPISQSHFLRMWREEAGHIAIPKNNRFSKCNTCTLIKIKLGETRDPQKRKILQEKRDKHLRKQNLERQKYYKHQTKAKSNPAKYLSIIIDGMDQSKTQIPHFVHASKFTSAMWKLRVHLVGVIVHGIGVYGFFDLFEYSHSTNLTISILVSVLYMLRESIPEILYLQMDNCARENKNRYLLAFMVYLVEKGVFKKIKVSFLMVGHTHEDVDQVFSKFSHWLSRHAVMSLVKLMEGFEKCFTPAPTSIRTTNVFNVTEWLIPHLNTIKNHSKPHVFKIVKDDNGRGKIFWKEWSTDKTWNETGDYLLKTEVTGNPSVVEADYSDIQLNFEKLESDVRGSFKYFAKEEDKQWWESFFQNYEDRDNDEEWYLDEIIASEKRPKSQDPCEEFDFPDDEDSPVAPVIIGHVKHQTRCNSEKQFRVEDFVLVDIPKYAGEWPQVCQVLDVNEQITVRWYKGSKSTAWTPCTKPVAGARGKREPWIEKISKSQIWTAGFQLTPSGHLPKKIKEDIDKYEQY